MEREVIYVGIDVAKAQVDVAVRPTGDRWEVSYDDAGVGKLVSQMGDLGPAMVLLEASGGLELPLVAALAARLCLLWWSIPAKCETLPGPPGRWPRPTLWMLKSWLTSPRSFVRLCAPCGTPRPSPSILWSPADTRS